MQLNGRLSVLSDFVGPVPIKSCNIIGRSQFYSQNQTKPTLISCLELVRACICRLYNGKRIHSRYSGPPLRVLWPISVVISSSCIWPWMLKIHPSSQCIQVRHQGTTDLRRKNEKYRETSKFYLRNSGFVGS